ncbi:tetratricopeptide repeat protein [Streptomyces sp. NBC_00503]|uniref:tetratricopeptide repeat protein n=1 Tax=Streptomyces sp. NBC_00503 TaxID=2903659 RepID=UPI002E82333E|nr:hypothetical protein [Streptomyces sp. NBC_00503]WUD85297.1 hypothetical protein OG490_34660 [Streptomyces sp. NBC_00503]
MECYEQFVSTRDPAKLSSLESLAMAAGLSGDLHALASAYLVAELPMEGLPLLEFLADSGPADPAVRCDLASAYILIGSVERASRELERILAAFPGFAAADRQLADVRVWLQWRVAEVDFQQRRAAFLAERLADEGGGIDEHIMLARGLYQLARIPRSGVDWPEVMDALNRARRLHGDHSQVLELLTAATHQAGAEAEWHEALLALERVAPRSAILDHWRSVSTAVLPNPDRLLAVASSGTEDAHGALRDLRSQYRLSPNNPDIQRCLMQAEVRAGNVAEGLWLADGLAATEALDFYGHAALAMVYGVAGDQRMDHHATEALPLAPDAGSRAAFQAQYDRVRGT